MSASSTTSQRELRAAFQKSFSVERGEPLRRRSLIEDARFDTLVNGEFLKLEQSRRRSITEQEEQSERLDAAAAAEAAAAEAEIVSWTVVYSPQADRGAFLAATIALFEKLEAEITSLEIVPGENAHGNNVPLPKLHINFKCTDVIKREILRAISAEHAQGSITVSSKNEEPQTVVWVPRHISDLDKCNHLVTKFEPDLDVGHPGFTDHEYRKRRQVIASIAFNYRQDEPIPNADYSAEEVQTWSHSYVSLKHLLAQHACEQHVRNFKLLENEGIYRHDAVPQLHEVSRFIRRQSGFVLRPVAGLLSARDFLASLAFRVFQCTQYVRHHSRPEYSPEPDCIHELLGHVPMLADPEFAAFSHEIGLLSLGTSDADIEKLASVYWFTVEFGLCMQGGKVKAYGAGLLSSFGELQHAFSGVPELRPFSAAACAVQPYQDENYQPVYFLAESFQDMKDKVRAYAATMRRPVELRYDPYTQCIQTLDSRGTAQKIIDVVEHDLERVKQALGKLDAADDDDVFTGKSKLRRQNQVLLV